jgi:hypothetical protein
MEGLWLPQVVQAFGEPLVVERDSTTFYGWRPLFGGEETTHSISFEDMGNWTVVACKTHVDWKPDVLMDFTKGYGPVDRDVDLMIHISQFTALRPRFN